VRVEELGLRGGSFAGDIDGAGGVSVEDGIGKGDEVGLGRIEDGGEAGEELVIGRVVRPEGKDAARQELGGEAAESVGAIEIGMALVEKMRG
jgi:hypothetical protein